MSFPVDKNGVQLAHGIRVRNDEGREGKVVAIVGRYRVFVHWKGEKDDELCNAAALITASAMHAPRRRKT
jgi:hypothetical protein